DHLERKSRNDPSDQVRPDAVFGQPRCFERPENHEQVETEGAEYAQKAELLREHGEDEVVVRDRQELVLALRALHEPLAAQPARANRDPGLNWLIPGAARILLRVDEDHDAGFLIVL